jgi:NTP pyrophosphatase (non-canonical NTP hydrolase)
MTPNQYQELAARTLIVKPDFQITDEQIMIAWTAIGLSGEAGEVAELVKKGIFHQHGIDPEKMKKELGDVLWYAAGLATQFGFTLEDVMAANVEKLKARFPDGYSAERSKVREGLAY